MTPEYFITPNETKISCIGKSGSTAIGKAILQELYPDKIPVMLGADASNAAGWQAFVPKVEEPDTAIVVVRDAVERFRSACSQVRRQDDVDEVLSDLESGGKLCENYHFKKSSDYLVENTALFKFPDHIADLARAIGLTDIPAVNDNSNNPLKPELTQDQTERVSAYYADDIALFNSITQAGMSYSKPPKMATDSDKQSKKQEVATARYNAEFGGFTDPTIGIFVRTDDRTRNLLTATIMEARANPAFTVPNWKLADGTFITLTAENIIYLYGKVWKFIQEQFAKEKTLCEQIDAAETVEAVRSVRWE